MERLTHAERRLDVDLVKTIAVFCIVCIHACGNGFYRTVGTFDWISAVFWGSLTRIGVPLFLMCSGVLMLDPEKPLPMKKLYGRSLPRLLIALFFWAAVYGVVRLALSNSLSWDALGALGTDLLFFRHETHLYFLHIMLLIYVLLPVTRCFVKAASKRRLEYALLIWFLVGILHATLAPYRPFREFKGIPEQWGLNVTWASLGYTVLGWYLKAYPLRRKWVFALLTAIGAIGVFGGTLFFSKINYRFDGQLLGAQNLTVLLLSVGVFGLCIDAKPGRWATYLSKGSFCVYLSHMLFLLLIRQFCFTELSLPCAVSIPLLTLAALACSLLLYELLRHIKFVNRWLI